MNSNLKSVTSRTSSRVLHDCPECFWRLHEGNQWQRAVSVPRLQREELRNQLGIQFKQMADNYNGGKVHGLGQPKAATCRSNLVEGGGACWFSSLYYLLTGRKSGKNDEKHKSKFSG